MPPYRGRCHRSDRGSFFVKLCVFSVNLCIIIIIQQDFLLFISSVFPYLPKFFVDIVFNKHQILTHHSVII
jgi:hypothetical protein